MQIHSTLLHILRMPSGLGKYAPFKEIQFMATNGKQLNFMAAGQLPREEVG